MPWIHQDQQHHRQDDQDGQQQKSNHRHRSRVVERLCRTARELESWWARRAKAPEQDGVEDGDPEEAKEAVSDAEMRSMRKCTTTRREAGGHA